MDHIIYEAEPSYGIYLHFVILCIIAILVTVLLVIFLEESRYSKPLYLLIYFDFLHFYNLVSNILIY